jgi:hypothetical protein
MTVAIVLSLYSLTAFSPSLRHSFDARLPARPLVPPARFGPHVSPWLLGEEEEFSMVALDPVLMLSPLGAAAGLQLASALPQLAKPCFAAASVVLTPVLFCATFGLSFMRAPLRALSRFHGYLNRLRYEMELELRRFIEEPILMKSEVGAHQEDHAEPEPPAAVTISDRKAYLQQQALKSGLSASFRQDLAKRPMRTSWGREMRECAVMMLQTM